ncbi:MAG: hypothetical protein ABI680_10830 [Chthoniobacteraceae bacterium]
MDTLNNPPVKDDLQEWIRIRSLTELDELIGTRLVKETPTTWWVEETTESPFPTLEEAQEALTDPYWSALLPVGSRGKSSFQEVKEFRRYSSDLAATWLVVQEISGGDCGPLRLQWENERGWVAAFGQGPEIISMQAPVAICVAALRARGIAVEIVESPDVETRF